MLKIVALEEIIDLNGNRTITNGSGKLHINSDMLLKQLSVESKIHFWMSDCPNICWQTGWNHNSINASLFLIFIYLENHIFLIYVDLGSNIQSCVKYYIWLSYIVSNIPKIYKMGWYTNNITNNWCTITIDMTIMGSKKISFWATIDYHGLPMHSGHHTATANCSKEKSMVMATTSLSLTWLIPRSPQ